MRRGKSWSLKDSVRKFYSAILLCFLFISAALAAGGYISDPTIIGIGARSLGMGKAYVAVAEDGDTIFSNPAGLAKISNFKLSSMYASFFNEINYTLLGGVYPLEGESAIGLGFVRASTSDILLTNAVGSFEGYGGWGNTVIVLSYGTKLTEIPWTNFKLKNVSIGSNLKYFMVGGDGVDNGSGSGIDMDMGILYKANDRFTLGANLQNFLPGMKVKNDSIASTLKLGTKITLIGNQTVIPRFGTKKLYANIDYDLYPTRSGPGSSHYGLEFWPTSNFALRMGFDNNDLTSGVGIRVSGVELNYAYHNYSGISENTTHYFSIGYLGWGRNNFKIVLNKPADKSIIYKDHVKIHGRVVAAGAGGGIPRVMKVEANGIPAVLSEDNSFSVDVPIDKYGENRVFIEASDDEGNSSKELLSLVRLTSFANVPEGYWAKQPIEHPDGTFRSEKSLTRAELVTLLVHARGTKLSGGDIEQFFDDVGPGFWAAEYIDAAVKAGIVTGYPDGTFRPNNIITRAEGIAVIVRLEGLQTTEELAADPYSDVLAGHWAAKYIEAARGANMLKFVRGGNFRPTANLTRSEAADMLFMSSSAAAEIEKLYK